MYVCQYHSEFVANGQNSIRNKLIKTDRRIRNRKMMVACIISQLLKKQMDLDHLHSWTNIQVNGPGSTEATKNF